jgi:hypothetical protein
MGAWSQHDFRKRITDTFQPYFRDQVTGKFIDELVEEFELYDERRDRTTLWRFFRKKKGFVDNFLDTNKRIILTINCQLYRNEQFVEDCKRLRLYIPTQRRFTEWEKLLAEAEELVAQRYPSPRQARIRQGLYDVMKREIFEMVLCWEHSPLPLEDQHVRNLHQYLRKVAAE